ncbi:MAG: IS630 family transposase, partial [Zetaproteobacteria bacterium]|nr:IS630 family transposase [Zetaproteobacteria bacterium]
VKGVKSLKVKRLIGRQSKLSKADCRLLKEWLEQSPVEHGFAAGGWNAGMISLLVEREFGVKYSTKYVPQLLKRLGFSYQKAKFEGGAADLEAKEKWLTDLWPQILAQAELEDADILFADEASFAMWGSLHYTWSPRGKQPIVPTSGQRKCYKAFGVINYRTGKLTYMGVEGKLNSESYINFLKLVKSKTRKPLIIVHDGAPYHRSDDVKDFLALEDRMTVYRLPAYAPELNPIEGLWKKSKAMATHLIHFPTFDELVIRVESVLEHLSKLPAEIMSLFGLYRKMKPLSANG